MWFDRQFDDDGPAVPRDRLPARWYRDRADQRFREEILARQKKKGAAQQLCSVLNALAGKKMAEAATTNARLTSSVPAMRAAMVTKPSVIKAGR